MLFLYPRAAALLMAQPPAKSLFFASGIQWVVLLVECRQTLWPWFTFSCSWLCVASGSHVFVKLRNEG
jgi:hypothetical protein